jgi:hypothetical protein
VQAIMLPAGHEVLHVGDDPTQDHWERCDEPSLLSYITHLPPHIGAAIQQLAPRYRLDHSRTVGYAYWMNHCGLCDAKLGDHRTHEELGVGFEVATPSQAERITLRPMEGRIEACCGSYSDGVEFFGQMIQLRDQFMSR